ncbi:hypothetical protein YPPY66_4136, partial [Yersinia pestis PY-66]
MIKRRPTTIKKCSGCEESHK